MMTNQQFKKVMIAIGIITLSLSQTVKAQSWNITGNSGINPNINFLGTTDSKGLVFRTNSIERGRVLTSGSWQFGLSGNYALIDSSGALSFKGDGDYYVNRNRYIFRFTQNKKIGLYLNNSQKVLEFRDLDANPVLSINYNTGQVTIGAYSLPATDGTNNQVLKTDGNGHLTWKRDNNTKYTAGAGISISSNTITNTAPSLWKINGDNIEYASGDAKIHSLTVGYGAGALPSNTAVGLSALAANTSGSYNTAIGNGVLYSNTTGYSNTANGYYALFHNTTGYDNTANGYLALFSNTTGIENTAIGYGALSNNTTGIYNTSIGFGALGNNTTGYYNTANGYEALAHNTTGYYNTTNGYFSLFSNTTGSNNSANGNIALYFNTTGNDNTAFGDSAGLTNTVGNGNTLLGANADVSSTGLFNATAIGYKAKVSTSNTIVLGVATAGVNVAIGTTTAGVYKLKVSEGVYGFDLADPVAGNHWEHYIATSSGNTSGGAAYTAGDMLLYYNAGSSPVGAFDHTTGAYKTTSDEKMKTNIKPMVSVLDKINQLEPVTYNFRNSNNPNASMGFIAQKVEKLFPSLVTHYTDTARKTDVRLMDYSGFGVIAIKGIQELESKSKEKDSIINIQQKQINYQQSQIDELKEMVANLSQEKNISTIESENKISLSSISLDQNIPNPLTNSTSIGYFIPSNIHNAQLIITDMSGKNLKQITLQNGKGNVMIDASTLSAGAYNYSLMVNGKIVASKKMVVAH